MSDLDRIRQLAGLDEAQPDGTISDDEPQRESDLLAHAEEAGEELAWKLVEEAYEIGGGFRGPGMTQRAVETFMQSFKRNVRAAQDQMK